MSRLKNIADVASQLIFVMLQIKPLEERADELKSELRRDFPGQIYTDPSDGSKVTISNKTEDRTEGVTLKFDADAYHDLPESMKKSLAKTGVVTVIPKVVKGSIPRVTVKLGGIT